MGHHAVQALVGRAGGGDDHLALALGEAAFLLEHEGVVVGEEGAPLGRASREGEKDIGNEAGLFLHFEDAGADVLGQAGQFGLGIAAGGHVSPLRVVVAVARHVRTARCAGGEPA